MIHHHSTIRKYTAALLDFFNGIEVQYKNSVGNIVSKSVPIVYTSREKSRVLEGKTAEQLSSGNYNVLPRANLSLSTLMKSDQRVKNKNLKINTVANADTFDYMYNSVPYEFTFELAVMCRGMNEASMIIEQIAPKFNPTVNIDIWDASNLNEPTRVPVKLLDIGIETEEYESLSSNIVTVSFGLSLTGNLYQPINSIQRIKDFRIYLNQQDGGYFSKKSILGWDVGNNGVPINGTVTIAENNNLYPPTIIDIVSIGIVGLGTNNISVIYDDKDNKLSELTFSWIVIQGNASIASALDNAVLTVNAPGNIEVQVTITDVFGNFASLNKIFIV